MTIKVTNEEIEGNSSHSLPKSWCAMAYVSSVPLIWHFWLDWIRNLVKRLYEADSPLQSECSRMKIRTKIWMKIWMTIRTSLTAIICTIYPQAQAVGKSNLRCSLLTISIKSGSFWAFTTPWRMKKSSNTTAQFGLNSPALSFSFNSSTPIR